MVKRIRKKIYEPALRELQAQLVELQGWVKDTGARVIVVCEGRDAAGKGGAIKRITEYLSPRVARVVALPAPTERERTQWYFQRYIEHLPSAGEIVIFDRSWYNRAGVERVMGFCTEDEYRRFLTQAPAFERMLVDDGIVLIKFWFSVSRSVQHDRFASRAACLKRHWKLSPMDLESIARWDDYTAAQDAMFAATDHDAGRWVTVPSDDKRHARLAAIAHLLGVIPWEPSSHTPTSIPELPDGTEDNLNESEATHLLALWPPTEPIPPVCDGCCTLEA
ncbi:MAG: polyphosphate kinase 2 [Promicromonosporaceae bacterium]|nr:polyphosphate kinase 2 [Promicromonosporaceae bacterium]